MALEINGIEREFVFEADHLTLADPDPEMTTEQVQVFYSAMYPQLTTATLHGPEFKKDRQVYTFRTIIGTKG
jgi:PRTRC genetic system protein C